MKIVDKLTSKYPELNLKKSDTFYWSPGEQTVFYNASDTSEEGVWAIIHESGHALLGHNKYKSDFELVKLEVEAWEKANQIAKEIGLEVDVDHIQDCLDSYRDWLHKRSLCPDCSLSGVQIDGRTYNCIFCHKKWNVTAERFCRPYRKSKKPPVKETGG